MGSQISKAKFRYEIFNFATIQCGYFRLSSLVHNINNRRVDDNHCTRGRTYNNRPRLDDPCNDVDHERLDNNDHNNHDNHDHDNNDHNNHDHDNDNNNHDNHVHNNNDHNNHDNHDHDNNVHVTHDYGICNSRLTNQAMHSYIFNWLVPRRIK